MTDKAEINFMMVNPTFAISARFPDPPGFTNFVSANPRTQELHLPGFYEAEVEPFLRYLMRQGAEKVEVVRHNPISFGPVTKGTEVQSGDE